MKSQTRILSRIVLFVLAVALTGCATHRVSDQTEPKEREGQVITRADIAESGARNALDALRHGAKHLRIQNVREGNVHRVTHRGVSSFFTSPDMLLVVDGTQMADFSTLRDIPAPNVDYIQILPARISVQRYGIEGGNGAVFVKTGPPPSRQGL